MPATSRLDGRRVDELGAPHETTICRQRARRIPVGRPPVAYLGAMASLYEALAPHLEKEQPSS
ncbi:MAG: hypothetical protein JXA74_11115 [Anaerolineae bacterium]|nr:hypothetical protein [Anaerolineae bacterium]